MRIAPALALAWLASGLFSGCATDTPTAPSDSRPALSRAPIDAPLLVTIDDVNACTNEPITLTYSGMANLQEFGGHFLLHVNGVVTTTDGYTGIFNWTFIGYADQVSHVSAHDMEVSDATGQRILFPLGLEQHVTIDGELVVDFFHFANGRVRCLGKPA
jgi:hypothetical protein